MASVSSLASQGLEMEGWKHVRSPLSISSTQSCNSSHSAEDAPHAPVVCDKAALCEKEPLARSQPTVPRSAPGLGLDIGADQAHPSPCSGCSVRDVSWVLLACSRNNYSAGIGMIPSRWPGCRPQQEVVRVVVVVHSTHTTCQWTFTSPNTSPTMQGELTINKSRGGKSKSECKTCCQMQFCFGLSDLHSDAEVTDKPISAFMVDMIPKKMRPGLVFEKRSFRQQRV